MHELAPYLAFTAGHVSGTLVHHYFVKPYYPDIPPFMIAMPLAMAAWYGYKVIEPARKTH